jgi:sugar transferase (PEP-CTERM/EpsH1 system associated)
MPSDRYRHAIVCLTEYSDFSSRIQRDDVPVFALRKGNGQDFSVHQRLWQLLGRLRPNVVHTRNLPTLECLIPAALARIPGRVHGEHGRDVYDLDGSNFKYNLLRKVVRPFAHRYTAVSRDLANWLVHTVGMRAEQVVHIYNGVDTQRFYPRTGLHSSRGPEEFAPPGTLVIGTVGRMQAVKDQLTLVRAFIRLLDLKSSARERVRLVVVGDGPLREEAQQLLRSVHAEHLAWLPGEREDISEIIRTMDLFVLPSLAEGISNTILEAMASGLPVVATRVGGNPELVADGETGMLVPPANPVAMAEAISSYLADPDKRICHGRAGRKRAEARFSMEAMVNGYLAVYDAVLNNDRQPRTVDRWPIRTDQ